MKKSVRDLVDKRIRPLKPLYDKHSYYKDVVRSRSMKREAYKRRRLLNGDKMRETERASKERNPMRQKAVSRVSWAIESGNIVKPSACCCCGENRPLQGHHDDYSKPLEVIWLCSPCHNHFHSRKDKLLSSLASLVLEEKKYLKGSDSPQDKYLEQMRGWNDAIDHIARLIKEDL